MGETEVIKGLMFLKEKLYNGIFQDRLKCIDLAIAALEEVQKYRQIGTVEECREAVEKQKPEKPEIYTDTIQTINSSFNKDVYLCSRCGQFIGKIDDELPRYCNCCGQRIDEDLEGME